LLDRVTAAIAGLAEPRLSYLRMSDPEAAGQLVAGFYQLENNAWRWMAAEASVVLKTPAGPARFEMTFFIPDAAPARRVTVAAAGRAIAVETYAAPGRYTLSAPLEAPGETVTVTVAVDRTFRPAGDDRELGMIVSGLGLGGR
jgi:hypothetical protein